MVSIEEYPFIFMNTPASLQVLASVEMALTLWRREFANTSYQDALEVLRSEEIPLCKKLLDVPVPSRIRAQIDKKIVSVGEELRDWMNFHQFRSLFGNSSEAYVSRSKHIVVDFFGSIDYKASAINMLNSGEFSDVVNYKIACTFCLEDQVKRFWPAVANDPPIDAYSPRDECNLSYWNGLMKVGHSITDTELVKLRMIEEVAKTKTVLLVLQRGDGTAFEYFCKMLPDDVRISKIVSWLELSYYDQAVPLIRTLSTLNRVRAEKVFEQKASLIFKILMLNEDYFKFAHQLWTLMGHLVLEDESKFCGVVSELWTMAFDPDCDDLNYTRCDQINDLLLEIWSNASEELKAYVSNTFCRNELVDFSAYNNRRHDGSKIFYRNNFACYYGHNMTFLLELLSKWRDWNKEHLWLENWQGLALRSKPLYLEQIMRICLPKDDDIEFVKIGVANFKDLFESLIEEGFYSDLKDYLLFCSEDGVQFQQLGKKVLGSNLRLILFHDEDKFAQFDWFVSEVFANVQKDADEFKSQMVLSANCLECLLDVRRADKISSKDFSEIIRRFVNDEEELQLVKRKLFEHFCEHLMETCFNDDQLQEFLEWCAVDHEEITAFNCFLDTLVELFR